MVYGISIFAVRVTYLTYLNTAPFLFYISFFNHFFVSIKNIAFLDTISIVSDDLDAKNPRFDEVIQNVRDLIGTFDRGSTTSILVDSTASTSPVEGSTAPTVDDFTSLAGKQFIFINFTLRLCISICMYVLYME